MLLGAGESMVVWGIDGVVGFFGSLDLMGCQALTFWQNQWQLLPIVVEYGSQGVAMDFGGGFGLAGC